MGLFSLFYAKQPTPTYKHYTYYMNIEKKIHLNCSRRDSKCLSGGNDNTRFTVYQFTSKDTSFTNRDLCVHMSLNNNSINIQCFHYCQQRRTRSLRCSVGVLRGREKSCSNTTLQIISWEKSLHVIFFHFH